LASAKNYVFSEITGEIFRKMYITYFHFVADWSTFIRLELATDVDKVPVTSRELRINLTDVFTYRYSPCISFN
jgi:hypothetical protein